MIYYYIVSYFIQTFEGKMLTNLSKSRTFVNYFGSLNIQAQTNKT